MFPSTEVRVASGPYRTCMTTTLATAIWRPSGSTSGPPKMLRSHTDRTGSHVQLTS